MALILLALAAVGHMVLWVALINRIHAVGIRRLWIDSLTLVFLGAIIIAPLAIAWVVYNQPSDDTLAERLAASSATTAYLWICAAIAVVSTARRLVHWQQTRYCDALNSDRASIINLPQADATYIAPGRFRLVAGASLNQVLRVRLEQKELAIPGLPAGLSGLRVAHISDLHYSGRIEKSFFDAVLEAANACRPDLIAITGDLVDGEPWVDWIPSTIGRLRAKHGVYYVLGNHDLRASEARIKAAMEQAGAVHVGGRCLTIDVDGTQFEIGGNELPWYTPASEFGRIAKDADPAAFRLLLAHSPDQFAWAVERDVSLMLAGHLHGGQICFPVLGAITSPSIYGVRYVGGVHRERGTVMHVSRGVGALMPVRVNCPPEIAILTLRQAQ